MHAAGDDNRTKKRLWFGLLAVLAAALLVPPVLSYPLSFSFYLMLWITMASSMNLMAGLTGYIPFGYVAFYGVGAYATAISVSKFDAPIAVGLLGAVLIGAVLSLLLAPTLRLRGIYFAMVSLAFAMIGRLMISELPEEISGGSFGLVLAPKNNPTAAYLAMLATMLAVLCVAWFISSSRLGVALRAIRDDPEVAEVLGVNVTIARLKAWITAGTFASLVGGIEAWYTNLVDPDASFSILISAKSLIFAMAGGLGTLLGPLVGASMMVWIDDFIWQRFPLLNLFFLGAVIVGLMLFMPRGIVGAAIGRWPHLRRFIP